MRCARPLPAGRMPVLAAGQLCPDLILMDIHLSGVLDGIEAAEQIIARYNIPIVFLTGYTDPETAERARRLNPVGFYIKPVSLREIQKIILDWQQANRFPLS